MSFYLKLRNPPEGSRFIFFELLEEIPMGGTYMQCGKWKYAQEFETREEAEEFKWYFDNTDHYMVVDKLHDS